MKDYLRLLAPRPAVKPVERFETAPGKQAQQDWSPYDVGFGRVRCFSYILGYSRRQFVEFTEGEDFFTLIRCHVRAFEHLGGIAETCLYDNQKAIVLRWEADVPIYNTRFLAFATHYGFRPKALRPRKPEHKGKVERPFWFLETSFFNCREFRDKPDLDEQLREWMAHQNDGRVHKTTRRLPRELHAEELPSLLPLPAHPYDTAQIVYRIASVEGLVPWDGNHYSVPPEFVTQPMIVRVRENDLIIYSPALTRVTEHELVTAESNAIRRKPEHKISRKAEKGAADLELLLEPFRALGPAAAEYLTGLERTQRRTLAHHVARILELKHRYGHDDIGVAIEHAGRYHSYDFRSVERILASRAQERSIEEPIPLPLRQELTRWLADNALKPRSLADYQALLDSSVSSARAPEAAPTPDAEATDVFSTDGSAEPQDTQACPHGPDPGPGAGSGREGLP